MTLRDWDLEWTALAEHFRFEDPRDADNEVTIYPNKAGGLYISVAQEQAVDSYNQMFECYVTLDGDAAKRLRDYLNEHLK